MHASAYMHADPWSEGVSWQLLSGAKHSSVHKNFANRRSLETSMVSSDTGAATFSVDGGKNGGQREKSRKAVK